MRFLLFGTGDYYNRYKKWFDGCEVLALLDNSVSKQHTFVDGIEVLSPEEGVRLNYDTIVILSFHVKQMKKQLILLGVEQERIYHFYDLHRLLGNRITKRSVQYFGNAFEILESRNAVPKILLLSHDMTLGGPSIALFHAAEVLIKHGYAVVYASMIDGLLKENLIKNDIPVIIDENLQISTMHETDWVQNFSLIVCNTLNFHVFLSERNTDTPIIWWLHDARFFYDGVNRQTFEKISFKNLKAVSVGSIPQKAVREFLPDLECGELLYGVQDIGMKKAEKCGSVTRFATIGFLEDIKGQDILLQAVRELPASIRCRCAFYIVGHNRTLYGEKIQSESAEIPEIIFMGSVSREEIHRLLSITDVLICPSRQDSMPTVAAEAMMHSVSCILSDVVGTAAYINDGMDGLIFPSEDISALAEKITWCVENSGKLSKMGGKARNVYESHFSMPVFEESLLELINGVLNNNHNEDKADGNVKAGESSERE